MKKGRLNIHVDRDLRSRFKAACSANGKNMTEVLVQLMEMYAEGKFRTVEEIETQIEAANGHYEMSVKGSYERGYANGVECALEWVTDPKESPPYNI